METKAHKYLKKMLQSPSNFHFFAQNKLLNRHTKLPN